MYYKTLPGKRIGGWTVLRVDSHGTGEKTRMLCRCDCGSIQSVDCYSLVHGISSSCGKCGNRIIKEGEGFRCIMKNGASFVFDAEDEVLARSHTWSISRGYARTVINGKTVFFHKLVLGNPANEEVDHINMDRLDNRRCNLRLASHSQNQQNRKAHRGNRTGYKGVCLDSRSGRYFAYINANGKRTYLGYFSSAVEAAEAYNRVCMILHRDFARPNDLKEKQNAEILELEKCTA